MEGDKDREILKAVAEYRNGLQNILAQEAVKTGFLKDSVRSIPELSGFVRSFFEHCVREYHSLYDHVEPLAVLGSCCFAGAAAAHLWNAVGEELLRSNLFVLLSRERGMKYLDDTAQTMVFISGRRPRKAYFSEKAAVFPAECRARFLRTPSEGRLKPRQGGKHRTLSSEKAKTLLISGLPEQHGKRRFRAMPEHTALRPSAVLF